MTVGRGRRRPDDRRRARPRRAAGSAARCSRRSSSGPRRAGATSLLLEVRADNAPAIALYERHGFDRIAVRRRYYQPGDVDAWVMRLRPLLPLV